MKKLLSQEKGSDIIANMTSVNEMLEKNPELIKYGRTPVIYKPNVRPVMEPGISSFIENSTSIQEINNLLVKGKTDYKNASGKTIRKWEKIAKKRIEELIITKN